MKKGNTKSTKIIASIIYTLLFFLSAILHNYYPIWLQFSSVDSIFPLLYSLTLYYVMKNYSLTYNNTSFMPLFLRGMAMTIFASVSFGFLAYLLLHYDDRIIENYFSTLLQFITTIQVEDQMLDRLMDYFNLYFNKETLCILLVVMHIAKGAILVCIMYYTLLIFKQR